MRVFKRAAIVSAMVVAGIGATAGMSQAAWYDKYLKEVPQSDTSQHETDPNGPVNDRDTKQDRADCHYWFHFAEDQLDESSPLHRHGKTDTPDEERELDEMCAAYAANGLDTTMVTWKEHVANVKFMGV